MRKGDKMKKAGWFDEGFEHLKFLQKHDGAVTVERAVKFLQHHEFGKDVAKRIFVAFQKAKA